MAKMVIGRYIPNESIIHKLDPRTKLGAMILLMVGIFIGNDFTSLAIIGLVTVIVLKLSKLSIWKTIKALKYMWFMILFLSVINIFMIQTGELLWTTPIFDIDVYSDALVRTGFIVSRIALMISLSSIVTTTTKPLDLTLAIEWYLAPLKLLRINTHIFAMIMSIALRTIPTLVEEVEKISKAQASRGLDMVNGKLKEKIRGLIALIIPLLVVSFKMASDMADAMEVRGYDPSGHRTRFRILKLRVADYFAVLIIAGIVTYVFLIKYDVVGFL